ncbi:hypothetical protein FBEOM_8845 [Fusarium beomiforme]|uniref:Uncharacterized protein n=1 Tax=Fusarium beomiforme TaxID=44412 RepID=A0A9P5DU30_9HYPO|nr:hypothetical protein FBEOM_8845 [Fusarium beomiforme]
MGNVLIDAYAVNSCNTPEFRSRRTREKVLLFIKDYKLQRERASETLSDQPLEEDIIAIASFHSSVIRGLLEHYSTWARANLEGLSEPQALSRIEERRIIRGLYRFQLFCSLFGAVRGRASFFEDGILKSEERLNLFLDEYEAWEIEEILCINVFVQAKYPSVFETVQWHLHPDNPFFDDRRMGPETPPGAFRLVDGTFSDWYRNGMACRGLNVLFTVLTTKDQTKLAEVISSEIVTAIDDMIFETTRPDNQERRRIDQHSDRDKAQDNREKMSFSGDNESSPPLAWVTFWKERYSNLFGDFLPRSLRQWGYIMWDRSRLLNTDAIALIDREWKSYYDRLNDEGEPEDPRDDIMTYT